MKKEKSGVHSSFSALLPELLQLLRSASAPQKAGRESEKHAPSPPQSANAEHPYLKILRRHEAISRRIDEAEAARRERKE